MCTKRLPPIFVAVLTCMCILTLPAAVFAAEDAGAQPAAMIIRPDQIEWKDTAEFPGLKVAVVYGDPSLPGPYVMYARFKPGFMTRPHYHTADRYVTVISGTWWATIGKRESKSVTTPLSAGMSMLHTAGLVHFDGARESETVVQITGVGPVDTVYVDQADN